MNPASLAVETAKVVKGKDSVSEFMLYCFVAFAVDAIVENPKESASMFENIFVPTGAEDLVFIAVIIGAAVIPWMASLIFKENSKGKGDKWLGRYIFTLGVGVIMTPTITLYLTSLIASRYFADIDAVTYIIVMLVVMVFVGYGVQKVLNEGIKALIDQVLKIKGDVDYAQEQLKKL